jgi:hypothetical protein
MACRVANQKNVSRFSFGANDTLAADYPSQKKEPFVTREFLSLPHHREEGH